MTQVKCPKCGFTNSEGKTTCARCGGSLPRVRVQSVPGNLGQQPGAQTFRRGQVIAGRYTIVDIVGRGGMGCIYRVQDTTLNEQVALKTLLPQFLTDKLVVERFFNEARIARQLSHPNIVRVHDIGIADNILYISMEYLKGRSLRGMINQLVPGQRLPVTTTLQVMLQLCAALEYAHQYTVHRDIKPENVMIMDDGSVKLMDFGISKLMTTNKLTATSVVMGTPYYMSPEQIKDSSTVDARADIYSIGVMLYEILTGNLPTGVPKPASQIMMDVPPSLDPIVAKCVEPNPNDRYQTVADLKAALRAVLALIEDGSTFEERGQPPSAAGRRGAIVARVTGVVLVALVVALAAIGLKGLEVRRHALLESHVTTTPEPATPSGEELAKRRLDRLFRAVGAAQRAAAGVEATEDVTPTIERGNQLLDVALTERKFDPGKAERLASQAAQCFLAVLSTRPPDVLFVPPAETGENGFYIDAKPVSPVQFATFAADGAWRPIGPAPSAPGEAFTNVTYYDAAAYAAFSDARLPTFEEWKRACDAHGEDMAGSVYEWTSTVANADRKPTFGDQLTICRAYNDANDETALDTSGALEFDGYSETVGFRCVHDIPTDPESIEPLLP